MLPPPRRKGTECPRSPMLDTLNSKDGEVQNHDDNDTDIVIRVIRHRSAIDGCIADVFDTSREGDRRAETLDGLCSLFLPARSLFPPSGAHWFAQHFLNKEKAQTNTGLKLCRNKCSKRILAPLQSASCHASRSRTHGGYPRLWKSHPFSQRNGNRSGKAGAAGRRSIGQQPPPSLIASATTLVVVVRSPPTPPTLDSKPRRSHTQIHDASLTMKKRREGLAELDGPQAVPIPSERGSRRRVANAPWTSAPRPCGVSVAQGDNSGVVAPPDGPCWGLPGSMTSSSV